MRGEQQWQIQFWAFSMTQPPHSAPRLHQVDEYAALLEPLGVTTMEAAPDSKLRPEWKLRKDAEAEAEVDELLAGAGIDAGITLVGLHLGVRHQGHLVKEDVRLGNLWSTVFERMNVPLPRNFQGGEADGIIRELV